MTKVIADITMSLDGFVAPSGGDVDELQTWVMEQDPIDRLGPPPTMVTS